MKQNKKNNILSGLIVFLTIFFAFSTWLLIDGLVNRIKEDEFIGETKILQDAILDRLEIYTSALYGGRGLFAASNEVDRAEWKAYVESLEIERNYPGTKGLGYSIFISPEDLRSHESKIQAEGFPNYKVKPEGKRDIYSSIIYLEPFDERNKQAFGYDMFQQAIRQKAMITARDSGLEAMSAKVTLVQEIDEDIQAGFLIYTPLYQKNSNTETIQQKRENIIGYIYSPFRMRDFIEGALKKYETTLSIKIYDGANKDNLSEEDIMYEGKRMEDEHFIKISNIDYGSHSWTIKFAANKNYATNYLNRTIPLITFVISSLIGLMVLFLIYTSNNKQKAAEQLANKITQNLRKKTDEIENKKKKIIKANKELEKKAKDLEKQISEVERINKYMVNRELKMIELKRQMEQLKKRK